MHYFQAVQNGFLCDLFLLDLQFVYPKCSGRKQRNNRTGSGAVKSWAEIAHAVFDAASGNGDKVVPVSTADYYASTEGPIAPRPVHSALDLSKLEAAGFHMPDWEQELEKYLMSSFKA